MIRITTRHVLFEFSLKLINTTDPGSKRVFVGGILSLEFSDQVRVRTQASYQEFKVLSRSRGRERSRALSTGKGTDFILEAGSVEIVLIARDNLPSYHQSFGGGGSEYSLAFEYSPLKERKELRPIGVLVVNGPSRAEL